MTTIRNPDSFLRRVLIADAAISGASGLVMLAGAGIFHDLTALPIDLVRYAGLALLPFAVLVALIATRADIPRAGTWAVIAINTIWVVESFLLLFSGWVRPTLPGQIFVVVQALIVAGLAELEFIGLRRAAPRAIAA